MKIALLLLLLAACGAPPIDPTPSKIDGGPHCKAVCPGTPAGAETAPGRVTECDDRCWTACYVSPFDDCR